MGDKISALVAALVLASIVLAFIAPVIAQDETTHDDEGPNETTTPGTQSEPVGPGENFNDNQASPGGWPISPMLIGTIVGVVIIALVIVGVWKYLSGRPKEIQPELPAAGPPEFNLPLHKILG